MNSRRRSYRRRAIQRLFILIVLAAVIFSAGLVLGGSVNSARTSKAQAVSVCEEQMAYISIEVKEGDTLWTIADQYMDSSRQSRQDYIDEVIRLNHITDEKIQTGSYIMVPYIENVTSASL